MELCSYAGSLIAFAPATPDISFNNEGDGT